MILDTIKEADYAYMKKKPKQEPKPTLKKTKQEPKPRLDNEDEKRVIRSKEEIQSIVDRLYYSRLARNKVIQDT